MGHFVLLGYPHSDNVSFGSARSAFLPGKKHVFQLVDTPTSLLAAGFNSLWAEALNRAEDGEVTHFAMLHADIEPEYEWLDHLIDEMEANGLSFLSVVNAIKDVRGVTSTGVALPGEQWSAHRRLTIAELESIPETFTAADLGYPDGILLHNTGCWVADLRDPKWLETDENGHLKAFFTINDRVVRNEAGKWQFNVEPEDWFFSRRIHDLGIKAAATRKVKTRHYGSWPFLNHGDWGSFAHDWELEQRWGGDHVAPTGYWTNKSMSVFGHDVAFTEALCSTVSGTVLDLGCGAGHMVRQMAESGVRAFGVDGNPATADLEPRSLFRVHDLTTPLAVDADWVTCFEVGEHIPAQYEKAFLDNLTAARKGIVLSWAPKDQTQGIRHVNCADPARVRTVLARRGWKYDERESERLRSRATIPCYRRAMVFRPHQAT